MMGIATSESAQIIVRYVLYIPIHQPLVFRDPELIKEIAMIKKDSFIKPVWIYNVVNIYGVSILTAEGDHWKRHR